MGRNILLVDDEKPVLKALQRSLMSSGLKIFMAENGEAALAILAHNDIDIIISDMRMPNVNGHQLLRKVKEFYPSTIRLILSGYADENEITRAMLDGSSKMYLLKPWDSQLLSKIIQQLLEVRELLHQQNLLEFINKMDGLCGQPRIYNKLIELLSQDVGTKEIATVIEEDPAITVKILQIANSSFYGIKTGSIKQAIVYLGLTAVKSIVLATNLCETMEKQNMRYFNKELLWRHASITNQLVGQLYYHLIGQHIPSTASTVGLLHKIGWMAMLCQFPDRYMQISAVLQEQSNMPFEELEQKLIGVSHQAVGGYLLDWWDLPHQVIESAMFHHDPFNDNVVNKELVAIVHIASYYSMHKVFPNIKQTLDENTFSLLQTTKEKCECLIREV